MIRTSANTDVEKTSDYRCRGNICLFFAVTAFQHKSNFIGQFGKTLVLKNYGHIFIGVSLNMFLPVLDGENGTLTAPATNGSQDNPIRTLTTLGICYI